MAEQLELLADLLEIEGEDSFRVLAYRRAAHAHPRDRRLRSRSSRSTGKAKEPARDRQDDRGEDRPDRRGRRDPRADEAEGRSRRRSSSSRACPGSARRRRARIWQELGVTTLAELKEAAEAAAAAHARRARARRPRSASSRRSRADAKSDEPQPHAARAGRCRRCWRSSQSLREHPARRPGLRGGQRAPPPGDGARPRHHRHRDRSGRADRLLHEARRGSRTSRRRATRRRPSSRTTACASTCASSRRSAYGNLLQHFTGSKEHNVALRERGGAARASRSPSTASRTSRRGEVFTTRERGGALRAPRLRSTSRPSCARTPASSRPRGAASCPQLVELGDLRGDLHSAHDWSATARTRSRRWSRARAGAGYEYYAVTDHSHYLRDGRLEAQAEEIDALQRARRALPRCCAGSR